MEQPSMKKKKKVSSCSRFTCIDAIEQSCHHDHLKGRCCLAQDHQHSSEYSHKIVQQKASLSAAQRDRVS